MADVSLHKQPTIFGIRHHGPGSARALVDALHSLQPDIVLIEGPADATELLPWLGHDEMEPPVALIMYRVDQPNRASFFPFALFSPEYQAVQYALEQKIAARFMDLPQSVMLAADAKVAAPAMDALQEIALSNGTPRESLVISGLIAKPSA